MKLLMGFAHRQAIIERIPKNGMYLEWGSGGSTVWLAEHLPEGAQMTSIENNAIWANRVHQELVAKRLDDRVRLCSVHRSSGKNATFAEEDPSALKDYIKAGNGFTYDVILVDGVARVSCALRAKHLLKPGGVIVIHDFQRGWYDAVKEIYETVTELSSCPDYPTPTLWIGRLPEGHSLYTEKNATYCLGNMTAKSNVIALPETTRAVDRASIVIPATARAIDRARPKPSQRNTILWYANVMENGGTAGWMLDAVRVMGSTWHHVVRYMHGDEKHGMGDKFRALGCDVAAVPALKRENGRFKGAHKEPMIRKETVEQLDPCLVVLSNTLPTYIEGEHPWSWLTGHYTVAYVHHTPINPWLPSADIDIFVSEFVRKRYEGFIARMAREVVIPPGIDTKKFAAVKPKKYGPAEGQVLIGRYCSMNKAKFPDDLVPLLKRAISEVERDGNKVAFEIVGGSEFYGSDEDLGNIKFLPFGARPVTEFLERWDAFFYRTSLSETWCRSVTEALAASLPVIAEAKGGILEQIEHERSGLLFYDDDEFVSQITRICASYTLRSSLGFQAGVASKKFDISKLREVLEPFAIEGIKRRRG